MEDLKRLSSVKGVSHDPMNNVCGWAVGKSETLKCVAHIDLLQLCSEMAAYILYQVTGIILSPVTKEHYEAFPALFSRTRETVFPQPDRFIGWAKKDQLANIMNKERLDRIITDGDDAIVRIGHMGGHHTVGPSGGEISPENRDIIPFFHSIGIDVYGKCFHLQKAYDKKGRAIHYATTGRRAFWQKNRTSQVTLGALGGALYRHLYGTNKRSVSGQYELLDKVCSLIKQTSYKDFILLGQKKQFPPSKDVYDIYFLKYKNKTNSTVETLDAYFKHLKVMREVKRIVEEDKLKRDLMKGPKRMTIEYEIPNETLDIELIDKRMNTNEIKTGEFFDFYCEMLTQSAKKVNESDSRYMDFFEYIREFKLRK